ncbi:MAG: hypothetical protein QXU36_08455 [Thermofilum sp.]|uniref:hypothetical protein n=1 Tax=Thermoprotei TaxID=183924 RepID=UPI0031605081
MTLDYLVIMDRVLVRQRTVIGESTRYFKVYLPMEFNDLWERLKASKRLVDVIVFLPSEVDYVDKVLMSKREIVRENERYKIYLSKRYNSIWEKLDGKTVDLLIVFCK